MKRLLWLACVGLLAACSRLSADEPKLQTADAYCERGSTSLDKGEYDKAIADFTEAIRLNPKNANAYSKRGEAYMAKHDYDKCIADCTEAIRLDPKDARAYTIEALCTGRNPSSIR